MMNSAGSLVSVNITLSCYPHGIRGRLIAVVYGAVGIIISTRVLSTCDSTFVYCCVLANGTNVEILSNYLEVISTND